MSFFNTILGPKEIRLVTLLPSSKFSSPIDCTIQTVQIDDKPEYEALSYVWEKAVDSNPIHISGERFEVTKNL